MAQKIPPSDEKDNRKRRYQYSDSLKLMNS
jgi:hypothetical protein